VLIEGSKDGLLVGRSHRDAPEIDGLVYVKGDSRPGSIVECIVREAEHYDLYAKELEPARALV
jgi:ribosomal protein S12 methylthiotransferase